MNITEIDKFNSVYVQCLCSYISLKCLKTEKSFWINEREEDLTES